jgi:ribosomal-protein-alanine N-acetyltransferase
MKPLELVPIDRSGAPVKAVGALPEMVQLNCEGTAALYERTGFVPPWIGYVGVSAGRVVGGGGFNGPARDNRVEIAYYTVPELEGRGFATATARELIEIARSAVPDILLTAQTLPVENASNALLKKLGFRLAGTATDPEAGEVWEWHLPSGVENEGERE